MRISDWSSDVCFSDLVRYIGWEGDQAAIATLAPGDIAVLENTRFFSGEEKNDPKVVDRFAAIGDFYVNDAFSAAHRAHASRSEEHTSELQSLMRISYAVFCLKKKKHEYLMTNTVY